MKISKCRSCEADIIWADTWSNRRMPVNAAPDEGGTILLIERPGNPPMAKVMDIGARDDLRRSHFATCPQSDEWRTSQRKA